MIELIYKNILKLTVKPFFILWTFFSIPLLFILILSSTAKEIFLSYYIVLVPILFLPLVVFTLFITFESIILIKIFFKFLKNKDLIKKLNSFKGYISYKIACKTFNLTVIEAYVFLHIIDKSSLARGFYKVGNDSFDYKNDIPEKRRPYAYLVFYIENKQSS